MLQQQIAGKYALLGQLEDQGSAEVYKVRHLFLEEVRLITVVHPPSLAMTEEVTERFLRDARAAIKLRHPNIAQLHDFSIDEEGTAYIVTEFIEGLTLEEALAREGPPPVELTLTIARQALRALAYLHRSGMVHRDISPDKLVLTRDADGRALVKWVDLGTAQVLAMSDGLPAGAGIFPARPKYASPEQFSAAGEGTVDARGDLYSFGVVLYELLTGRCPIPGKDPFSLMVGHLSTPPVPFAESDPEGRVPGEVREIVLSTLAKKPEDRIASADELARRLASLLDPLADDRGEYLDRVLQRAHQKTAVVILPPPPPPAPAATPEKVEEPPPPPPPVPAPVAALTPVELPPMEPPPAPPVPEPPRAAEPVRDPRPAGPQWDQLDMAAYATQALRVDPVIPSEATRRTLLEPLPAPPPAASAPIAPAPTGPSMSRPILIGVGAGVLAALLIGAGWWLGGSHRSAQTPAPAPDATSPETTAAPPPAPLPTVEVKAESNPKREKARRPEEAPASAPPSRPAERRAERKVAVEVPVPAAKGPDAEVPPPSPPGRGRMITGGPGVESAEATSLGVPVYPERARGTGRKVTIKVAVLVDENGNVAEVRIKEGDPSGLGFNEAARDAARRTHFLPATQDGVPGKSWTDLNFEFVEPGGG